MNETPAEHEKKDVKSESSLLIREIFIILPSWIFNQLLRIFFNSKREKSLGYYLGIVSFLLTVSSAYTTYIGVNYFIRPWIPCLFLTIGIQGILFATSWRIGEGINQDKIPPFLIISYFITFFLSVFFSYSALLDQIYDKNKRQQDEYNRSIKQALLITSKVADIIETNNKKKSIPIVNSINLWFNLQISYINSNPSLQKLRNEYIILEAEYNRLFDTYKRELNHGITPNNRGITSGGRGIIAIQYENKAQGFYFSQFQPIKTKINQIDSAETLFKQRYNTLSNRLTSENLNNLNAAFNDYKSTVIEYIQNDTRITDIPQDIVIQITENSSINIFLQQKDNISFDTISSTEGVRKELLKFVKIVPKSEIKHVEHHLEDIETIGKYGGEKAHPFVLAINELLYLNRITFLPLFLAFGIDLLILLCGLLLAKPKSFLKMNSIKDLKKYDDLIAQYIFSFDLDEFEKKTKNAYINRLTQILRLITSDLDEAYNGLPAFIEGSKINNPNLAKEIGSLIALQFAVKNPDNGRIYLKVEFLMWAIEQVLNSKFSDTSLEDILKTISQAIKDK